MRAPCPECDRTAKLPSARQTALLIDSAGVHIDDLVMGPRSVYVLCKVKEKGYPLNDESHSFRVLQRYDLHTGTLQGEWHIPSEYEAQRLVDVDIASGNSEDEVAALYQGTWKTTLVYYRCQ